METRFIKSICSGAVALLLSLLLSGCSKVEHEGLQVWVSVQPQSYLVQRIGGDAVSLEVLVRPGQSPEMYAPVATQMAQLARADLYLGIGVPIEAPLFRRMTSSMPGVRVVATGVEPDEHAQCGIEGHDHHHHDHGAEDPHIWLDPVRMIALAELTCDALIEATPESTALFQANTAELIADLEALNVSLQQQFAPYTGRAFFINHPALGHFATRYGLVQMSIEQAGSAPSARRIADLIEQAREAQVGAIFTQPEFGRTTATVLADALDVPVVELDLLSADYIANMHAIADALEGSLAQ